MEGYSPEPVQNEGIYYHTILLSTQANSCELSE